MPQVQAQQAAPLSPADSIEDLKSRRAAIESMTDIDETVMAESLHNMDEAIAYKELADSTQKKTDDLLLLIQTAPDRLKALQSELKSPFKVPEKVDHRAQQMSTLKLEQRVHQKEVELSTAQSRLKNGSDRLAEETAAINQIPDQSAMILDRLKEIDIELQALSGAPETDVFSHTKLLSLQAEQKRLSTENNFNEQRQRSQSLLVELLSAERDLARKAVESRQIILKLWQTELQKRRGQEAVQAREDAQDAISEIPLLPKVVQDQFNINVELGAELEQAAREETELTKNHEDYQVRLNELAQELETAKKRIESAVLTETIGMALRSQRLNLPSSDKYYKDTNVRKIRMSEISERQIALDAAARELADPNALAEKIGTSVSTLSDVERKALDIKIQELAANRVDLIQRLNTSYNRIFKLIQDIEFTEQRLASTADAFGEFLDRHLLWIRSSKPVGTEDIPKLKVALAMIFKPASWSSLFNDIGQSFKHKTAVWLLGILVGVLTIVSRRRAKKALKDIAECVQQQVEDSFMLTIKALGLTLLLAAAWPYAMAFAAFQLSGLSLPSAFSESIRNGLASIVGILALMVLLYNLLRSHGLVQAHFDWPESIRRTLKNNLRWLIPITVIAHFFIGVAKTSSTFEFSHTVANLALMTQAVALSVFSARVLRFSGGITSVLIDKRPDSWLSRLRYIWYPAAILLPISILVLALSGYFYSALEIRNLIRNTVALFFGLLILNDLAKRMLLLAKRKIALKRAIANQELQLKSSSGKETSVGPNGIVLASPMEPVVEIRKIDAQTQTFIRLVLFIFALAGMWAIWKDLFPAFGILQDIQFWSYSSVVDGVAKTVPITLGSILLAAIIAVTTVIASRNLPGLLEVILLNRLPMDPGARYAYSSVCRYVIVAIGIVITFNAIGLQWAKLQWLLAALSVGLGFGLQEIVANFICGLIVLFERPCTVGDTITIGDTSGTVSRIRIRATTIVDWDRKELIVPNKEFVVGRLVNWSLSDKYIRIRVPVGIAYGSDTKLAEKLLIEAARKNKLVVSDPEPSTFFKGFGDNSLDFELRVYIDDINNWIPMLNELNMKIDDSFKKAGVCIAFPQRDVHLDATGPLDVRVVSEPTDSG